MNHRLSPLTFGLAAAGFALLTVGAAGCKHESSAKPLDQLSAREMHGHQIFAAQCSMCHNERDNSAKVGPALDGLFRKPYLPSGAAANDERVTATIHNGRGMMPAQPFLQGDDLNDLLAYLHTL